MQTNTHDNLACLFETHTSLLLLTALLIYRALIKEDYLQWRMQDGGQAGLKQ
jgi:hypothetical protein